jgi:uncharacterized membrane protein
MNVTLQKIGIGVVYLIYAYFCWLLVEIALQYIPFNTDVAFLRIKQDEIAHWHYKVAFATHVYTTLLVLPAGFIQFSSYVRAHYSQWHRMVGWVYILVVLLFASPSGFWMGLYANGGITSQISFCLLAILWFYFTLKALLKIKQHDFVAHRNFMIRSFSLTLSAITLRFWKTIIVYLFHPHPMDVYRIVAWLGWILNLMIAEYIIFKLTKK